MTHIAMAHSISIDRIGTTITAEKYINNIKVDPLKTVKHIQKKQGRAELKKLLVRRFVFFALRMGSMR